MEGVRELILKHLKENGITKKFLAERLGETPQNLDGKFKKSDFTTDYVRRISEALNHDFFEDLSKQYFPDADDWLNILANERQPAYSVSKEKEIEKWKRIIEALPDDIAEIKKQLAILNKK